SERLAPWLRQLWGALGARFAPGTTGSIADRLAPGLRRGGPDPRAVRGEADDPGEPTRWPPARRVWLASWPVMAVFGLVGLWQLSVAARGAPREGPVLWLGLAPALERSLASLGADDLPDAVGPYQREGFEVDRNADPGIRGEHSRV